MIVSAPLPVSTDTAHQLLAHRQPAPEEMGLSAWPEEGTTITSASANSLADTGIALPRVPAQPLVLQFRRQQSPIRMAWASIRPMIVCVPLPAVTGTVPRRPAYQHQVTPTSRSVRLGRVTATMERSAHSCVASVSALRHVLVPQMVPRSPRLLL